MYFQKHKNNNLYESLSAYGIGFHRHNSEIQQQLNLLTKKKNQFHFTPHLTPMFRGILSTIYLDLKNSISNTNEYLAVVNDSGLWIKEEIEFRKRLKELKKRDPFIYE